MCQRRDNFGEYQAHWKCGWFPHNVPPRAAGWDRCLNAFSGIIGACHAWTSKPNASTWLLPEQPQNGTNHMRSTYIDPGWTATETKRVCDGLRGIYFPEPLGSHCEHEDMFLESPTPPNARPLCPLPLDIHSEFSLENEIFSCFFWPKRGKIV